jgi:dTDP-4-dehydrorhamnose 3,5-epimerase
MIFHPTRVHGACLIEQEPRSDERGFFARALCEQEFTAAGLVSRFVQVNNSLSRQRGTLRGLHYQLQPSAEVKLVRAIRGALFDVIVDLRPDSPSYQAWFGAELTAENRLALYVPRGCAHAILTLTDDTEALYFVSACYAPQAERGLRWDDPAIGVEWPIAPVEISDKDRGWPDFDPAFHGVDALRGLL